MAPAHNGADVRIPHPIPSRTDTLRTQVGKSLWMNPQAIHRTPAICLMFTGR
jgi:hypothetical protein